MPPQRIYPDLKTFFRDNPDVTVTEVARDCNCSVPMVSMIKWGHRQPTLALALRLASRCSVPLESLLRSANPEHAESR
jgi:hypothetical protein